MRATIAVLANSLTYSKWRFGLLKFLLLPYLVCTTIDRSVYVEQLLFASVSFHLPLIVSPVFDLKFLMMSSTDVTNMPQNRHHLFHYQGHWNAFIQLLPAELNDSADPPMKIWTLTL